MYINISSICGLLIKNKLRGSNENIATSHQSQAVRDDSLLYAADLRIPKN